MLKVDMQNYFANIKLAGKPTFLSVLPKSYFFILPSQLLSWRYGAS
ncbi:protein of unknown function [Candidatus Nitrotoga arctica]|uniref:Reverse transcriptase (RNA-dependent DNA polymerase) n=1 Tax=Candidatus Nitrotoga arctica TaxID=453162 RepID=A0ABN8ALI9_9PROT|nr:protein of unknown function [Candidatus Nitrotoga arctica]